MKNNTFFELVIPVEINPDIDMPNFQVLIFISKLLSQDQEREIRELINSWYTLGFYGGYGHGYFSTIDDVVFDDEEVSVYFSVDMGSDELDDLVILFRAMNSILDQNDIKVLKVELF